MGGHRGRGREAAPLLLVTYWYWGRRTDESDVGSCSREGSAASCASSPISSISTHNHNREADGNFQLLLLDGIVSLS